MERERNKTPFSRYARAVQLRGRARQAWDERRCRPRLLLERPRECRAPPGRGRRRREQVSLPPRAAERGQRPQPSYWRALASSLAIVGWPRRRGGGERARKRLAALSGREISPPPREVMVRQRGGSFPSPAPRAAPQQPRSPAPGLCWGISIGSERHVPMNGSPSAPAISSRGWGVRGGVSRVRCVRPRESLCFRGVGVVVACWGRCSRACAHTKRREGVGWHTLRVCCG